jgi:hypothetical protein
MVLQHLVFSFSYVSFLFFQVTEEMGHSDMEFKSFSCIIHTSISLSQVILLSFLPPLSRSMSPFATRSASRTCQRI